MTRPPSTTRPAYPPHLPVRVGTRPGAWIWDSAVGGWAPWNAGAAGLPHVGEDGVGTEQRGAGTLESRVIRTLQSRDALAQQLDLPELSVRAEICERNVTISQTWRTGDGEARHLLEDELGVWTALLRAAQPSSRRLTERDAPADMDALWRAVAAETELAARPLVVDGVRAMPHLPVHGTGPCYVIGRRTHRAPPSLVVRVPGGRVEWARVASLPRPGRASTLDVGDTVLTTMRGEHGTLTQVLRHPGVDADVVIEAGRVTLRTPAGETCAVLTRPELPVELLLQAAMPEADALILLRAAQGHPPTVQELCALLDAHVT